MVIVSRFYHPKNDFELVRTFLINTYLDTNTYNNWFPDRFENSHTDNVGDICLWEEFDDSANNDNGKLVALANPESTNFYFIQIYPNYKFLEREIIEWIENHCKQKNRDPNKKTKVLIHNMEGDSDRESLLQKLKYNKRGIYGHLRIRPVNLPIPDDSVPNGFQIRAIRGKSEYNTIASMIRLVFGHGEWFTGEIIEGIANCSFYIQNLDLVVIAPNGTIAAFCTIRLDPVSKIASLEPLGVHPEYRKLGLAKAILFEALRRAKKYNPRLYYIGGAADTPGAIRLYDTVGYKLKLKEFYWEKKF